MTRFVLPSILTLVWLSACTVAFAQSEDPGSGAPDRGAVCDSGTNQVSANACPGDVSQPPVVTEDWNDPLDFCHFSSPDRHRSVDVVFRPGQEQWLAGKFAYGVIECDLKEEMVEIWIRTSCGVWELFGSVLTSVDSATVFHGIEDDGGRVFFTIPAGKRLGPGSYPVQMVVKGDGTKADSWLHVWEPGTKAVISDIDGTLTTLEHEAPWSLLDPALSEARPRSEELLQLFQSKGYRVIYLTARPESLINGTRAWLASKGFPIDVLHTSQALLTETAGPAFDFKQAFMMDLIQNAEVVVDWAYGNKESDLLAYLDAAVTPSHVYLVEGSYTGDLMGANSLSDFGPEVNRVMCLEPVNRFSIFADGFESGDATAWSSSVGVSP